MNSRCLWLHIKNGRMKKIIIGNKERRKEFVLMRLDRKYKNLVLMKKPQEDLALMFLKNVKAIRVKLEIGGTDNILKRVLGSILCSTSSAKTKASHFLRWRSHRGDLRISKKK